jgi:hypothetical protein
LIVDEDGEPVPLRARRATTGTATIRSTGRCSGSTGVPVWVGEFGPVYGASAERDAQRRRLLADQIAIYEDAGAGWSVWTYKDIGVQGLVSLPPASPWLTRTAAVRAHKTAVAADPTGA